MAASFHFPSCQWRRVHGMAETVPNGCLAQLRSSFIRVGICSGIRRHVQKRD